MRSMHQLNLSVEVDSLTEMQQFAALVISDRVDKSLLSVFADKIMCLLYSSRKAKKTMRSPGNGIKNSVVDIDSGWILFISVGR
ncbi:hypothetical protein CEXT_455071 [Caerostris extrusa]|uniref:Uncharacterized protein n=1 Tax=Caerostris extrusa TaxID=172846 RepID=A0AAV4XAB5_CAEEX|nr:hypothetical protein CEXT_455071 [Caerostris extrusa]